MPGLPSHRGPKATSSLVYCMARAASMCKAGPTGLSCGMGVAEAWATGAGASEVDAEAALSLEQPRLIREQTRSRMALRRKHKITPALLAGQNLETEVQGRTLRYGPSVLDYSQY